MRWSRRRVQPPTPRRLADANSWQGSALRVRRGMEFRSEEDRQRVEDARHRCRYQSYQAAAPAAWHGCKRDRKLKAMTISTHTLPVAANLLDQQCDTVSAPNKVWVADTTFIPTDEGWLYLAGVKDLYNRRIGRLSHGQPDNQGTGADGATHGVLEEETGAKPHSS